MYSVRARSARSVVGKPYTRLATQQDASVLLLILEVGGQSPAFSVPAESRGTEWCRVESHTKRCESSLQGGWSSYRSLRAVRRCEISISPCRRGNRVKSDVRRPAQSLPDVAQLGRASALGAEGRRFKSCYPDVCGDTTVSAVERLSPERKDMGVRLETGIGIVLRGFHTVSRIWCNRRGLLHIRSERSQVRILPTRLHRVVAQVEER